jgi:hypothetical protein
MRARRGQGKIIQKARLQNSADLAGVLAGRIKAATCMIKELDCVALTVNLPDYGLVAGDVGAVVHVYPGMHSYQVEFATFDGRTVAVAKVSASEIRPLGEKEIHHARAFEPAAR